MADLKEADVKLRVKSNGGILDMNKNLTFVLGLMVLISAAGAQGKAWKMAPTELQTRWASLVRPENVLPEYPRPQLVRTNWQNLNGLWDYSITPIHASRPASYAGSILVPFPLESALSGVQRALDPDQLLWYRRTVYVRKIGAGQHVLMHFGAVDYQATVFVNGREVGGHTGGYQSFCFDVTDSIKAGNNEVVIKVLDPTGAGPNPRGKQGAYTASSGIWQTVWMETVPSTYVDNLTITPDVDRMEVILQIGLAGDKADITIKATATNGATTAATERVDGTTVLHINRPHLWSPDDPFLYGLKIQLFKNGRVVDEVSSYFGMRKIEVKKDAAGVDRIFLNNRYTYNLGVLDQGFWPDGVYTAPTDDALRFDILAVKTMGFNTIRKHIKVEPDRWYYHCDKLGMLVWQDMVQPANDTPEARQEFEVELKANIAQLNNHPSIVAWVLFNEGWGAYDQARLARLVKALDPSRLLNGHTGPIDQDRLAQLMRQMDPVQLLETMNDLPALGQLVGAAAEANSEAWVSSDMTDFHHYPDPKIPPALRGKVRVVGENGGIGEFVEGHVWQDIGGFGYINVAPDQFTEAYAGIVTELKTLESQGLSGSIYTQLSDLEMEQNGLMTYDRRVIKIPLARIREINAELLPHRDSSSARGSPIEVANADTSSEQRRYEALVARYVAGARSLAFLRHFALMAVRHNDQARATEAGSGFLARIREPYSRATWLFISAVTRTSQDMGFDILRKRSGQADTVLGKDAAERQVRQIIRQENIEPLLKDKMAGARQTPDWQTVETALGAKYGPLGTQTALGAAMIHYCEARDWRKFGAYYSRYFAESIDHSDYSINNLSYLVLQHVEDSGVLEAAIRAERDSVESAGGRDAVEMDTYANLLYKSGRSEEAIIWEKKAMETAEGHDAQIADHYKRMQVGQPTWPAS